MQAVILAAGKSTRTYPLTITKPKPLLKICNKTLLQHNFGQLGNIVNEAIIVVGYKKNLIKNHLGHNYKNIKIKYVEQKQQLGTGNALLAVQKYIKNDFISLYGDDFYSIEDFRNIVRNRYAILIKKVNNPNAFGVILEKNGVLTDLIEKPQKFVSNMANTGLYKLDKQIFPIIRKTTKSKRHEYELTDAIKQLAKKEKVYCVRSRKWFPIVYPWDLLKIDSILRKNRNIIGKGSKVYGNVENSSIGDNCMINGTVRNSVVMDNTFIDRSSIAEDSVIGSNVHFSGKIIAKNNTFSLVKGKRIRAGRLGAIIADNVKAKNVVVNAGCKIWPNRSILNKTISKDVF
ncbi:NTP transferase domain-containing protein [Candidatus Woesearchaeota archaeon]|nr:NTP transferase domain-containing protein [Candidatus Woesearchaeota archaeon]